MDLDQFRRINVLGLPLINIANPPLASSAWPRAFFLHNNHHVIYCEKLSGSRIVFFDSLGRSSPCFDRAVHPHLVQHYFGTRMLQRTYRSEVCAIHAVLFSLGFYCIEPDYKMKAFVLPTLIRLKEDELNGNWYSLPLPFSLRVLSPQRTHR